MKYRNKITGAVITTNGEITGENWEKIAEPKKTTKEKKDA